MMRRTIAGFALASMFLVFLACNDSPTEPGDSIGYQTVAKTSILGYQPNLEGRETVRDQAAWQDLWAELHSGGASAPLPTVDFRRDMVIVVVGPGCNGTVTVNSIANRQGQLLVSAQGKACSNALCAVADFSVHIVRVPRLDLPVRVTVMGEGGLC